MDSKIIEARLESKGIRPTANRITVCRALQMAGHPLSLADIYAANPSLDKSSIFRVLTLFLRQDVVHAFEDGRGVVNYELCHSRGSCPHTDGHLHFYCEQCHRSFCLEDVHLPDIVLPEGFAPTSASFVVKGRCPQCASDSR